MEPIWGEATRYRSFLLRCWEVRSDRPGGLSTWQFSLEAVRTGERHGFRDLEALVAYLKRELWHEDTGAASAQEKEKE